MDRETPGCCGVLRWIELSEVRTCGVFRGGSCGACETRVEFSTDDMRRKGESFVIARFSFAFSWSRLITRGTLCLMTFSSK